MTMSSVIIQPPSIVSSDAIAPKLTPVVSKSTAALTSQQRFPMLHHQSQHQNENVVPIPGFPVAEFLYQMVRMLTEGGNKQFIDWDAGKIRVFDPPRLEKEVLQKYFRHSKYASFQRQLNYFGFRKIASKGKMSPCFYVNDAVTSDVRSLLTIKRRTQGRAAAKKAALREGRNKDNNTGKNKSTNKKRKQENADRPHTSSSKKQRTMPPPVSPTPSSFSVEGNETCTINAFPQQTLEPSLAQTAPMVVTADEFGAPFTNPALFTQWKPQPQQQQPLSTPTYLPLPELVPVKPAPVRASAINVTLVSHDDFNQNSYQGTEYGSTSVPDPLIVPTDACEDRHMQSGITSRPSAASIVSDYTSDGDASPSLGPATVAIGAKENGGKEQLHEETTCFLKNLLSLPCTNDFVSHFVESIESENQQRRKNGFLSPSPSMVELAMLPSLLG